MTYKNLSPVCERVNWDCASDYPTALLDVYCMFVFSPFFYAFVCISLTSVNILVCCSSLYGVVLRPNSPHETLTYPGPACSKDRRTDNVPAFGTATCIAAQKGRRPEGSIYLIYNFMNKSHWPRFTSSFPELRYATYSVTTSIQLVVPVITFTYHFFAAHLAYPSFTRVH